MCNHYLVSCIYGFKFCYMKRVLSLFVFAILALGASAQTETIMPLVKKKMLGVYNTSILTVMPVTRSNDGPYYYEGFYYPVYNERRAGFSFRNTTGYRFFDFLNLGAGVGLDNYESNALNIPFYGEISGNILNKRFFPSYYAQAGYGLGVNISGKDSYARLQEVEGGIMTAAGIGFGARLDKNTIIRLNFGYRLQKTSYTSEVPQYNMPPYTQVRHMTYHRIEAGLNFTFQQ